MVESCTKAWDDRHNVEEHRSCSISQSRRSTRDVGCAPYNLSFLFRSCTRKSPGTIALGGYVHSSKQGSTLIVDSALQSIQSPSPHQSDMGIRPKYRAAGFCDQRGNLLPGVRSIADRTLSRACDQRFRIFAFARGSCPY